MAESSDNKEQELPWHTNLWKATKKLGSGISLYASDVWRHLMGPSDPAPAETLPDAKKGDNAPQDILGEITNTDYSDTTMTGGAAIKILFGLPDHLKVFSRTYQNLTGQKETSALSDLDYMSMRGNPNYYVNIYKRLAKYNLPDDKLSQFKGMLESKPPSQDLSKFAYDNIVPLLKRANPHLDGVRGSTIAALATLLDAPSIDSSGQVLTTYPNTAEGLDTALRHKYQDIIAVNFLTDQAYKTKMLETAFGTSNIDLNNPRSVLEAFSSAKISDPFVLRGIAIALHRSEALKDIPLDTYTSAQARQEYLKDLADKEAQRAEKGFAAPQAGGHTAPLAVLSAPRLGARQPPSPTAEPSTPRITEKEFHNLAAATLAPNLIGEVDTIYRTLAKAGDDTRNGVAVQQLLWQIRAQAQAMTAANDQQYNKLTTALEARLTR